MRKKIRKLNYSKILKISLGGGIAIAIATALKLKFSVAAGVILLLTVQNTKKETLAVASKRFLSFLMAIGVAWVSFHLAGYNALGFGLFFLIFLFLSHLLKLGDGIAMSSVLTTHFYIEQNMQLPLIGNELALMTIGAGLGVLLNLIYMPQKTKAILASQKRIEEGLCTVLDRMAYFIMTEDKSEYTSEYLAPLKKLIKESLADVREEIDNHFTMETPYYLQYMLMRKSQCSVLMGVSDDIRSLTQVPRQAEKIANFLRKVSDTFGLNNGVELLAELEEIKEYYRHDELPTTREEFENRAILFQILHGIERMLILHREFVVTLSEQQIQTYWSTRSRFREE